jgi:hypothetical protein
VDRPEPAEASAEELHPAIRAKIQRSVGAAFFWTKVKPQRQAAINATWGAACYLVIVDFHCHRGPSTALVLPRKNIKVAVLPLARAQTELVDAVRAGQSSMVWTI